MGWMREFHGDVRWAVRALAKRPAYTLVALATLALGIGANSAVFTLVGAHFLEPLPYDRPDDLVLLWETARDSDGVMTVSPGNYLTWREEANSFSDIASFNVAYATLSGEQAAERVTASWVAPHFFDVLGVSPLIGPGFEEASARAANGDVVVLSHGLWTRRYGADPDLVGRDVRVDGRPHTVVGILPPTYRQPEKGLSWQAAELWKPQFLDDQRQAYGSRYLRTVARLAPGVSIESARLEMDRMADRMAVEFPEANTGRRIQVWTLDDYLMGESRPVLFLLLLAGGAVLAIVCANVANLTLARGQERRREFALRTALGSGRSRLLRQVLVESVVLALAGAFLGALLVYLGRDVLQGVQERFFSGLVDADVDVRVLLGTTVMALLSGLLFGLPLALTASSTDLRGALVEGGERAGKASSVTQNLLIVGQVGLATSLVVSALLLTRTFSAITGIAPGFEPAGVLTFSVSLPRASYPDGEAIMRYMDDVRAEVATVPGITRLGLASDLPFTTENRWNGVRIDGVPFDPTNPTVSEYRMVVGEYFEVMGIPVVAGAFPENAWRATDGEVSIAVNERAADMFWSGESPIGRTLELLGSGEPRPMRVAAVVANVLDDGFQGTPEPLLYLPWGASPQRGMIFLASTAPSGPEFASAVRDALGRVDSDVPVAELRMLEELMDETVVRPRAASLIGGLFAVIALLVAAAGIYGVLSYLVESRTREIGIRSALGATSEQLMGLVLGHSTRLLVAGLLAGVVGAVVAGRALSSLLYGVTPWDPVSLVFSTLALGVVGTLAAWIPARRAVGVDPREALRAE